jgi:hypothetical protein
VAARFWYDPLFAWARRTVIVDHRERTEARQDDRRRSFIL